jgi:quercetin 2,3-dioxygenase
MTSVLKLHQGSERGFADHGWLRSFHSFSFADFYDPLKMGFRSLRVINEDFIAGGGGFPMHGHRDMEIITYVLEGALEHRDSHGNSGVITRGEVQRMSAGSGVRHSEFNHSAHEQVHLFQIWLLPNKQAHKFSYSQKSFEHDLTAKKIVLIASGDPRDGAIGINQDADIYVGRLSAGEIVPYATLPERGLWLHVCRGKLKIEDTHLTSGDAAEISGVPAIQINALESSEFLLFDLA